MSRYFEEIAVLYISSAERHRCGERYSGYGVGRLGRCLCEGGGIYYIIVHPCEAPSTRTHKEQTYRTAIAYILLPTTTRNTICHTPPNQTPHPGWVGVVMVCEMPAFRGHGGNIQQFAARRAHMPAPVAHCPKMKMTKRLGQALVFARPPSDHPQHFFFAAHLQSLFSAEHERSTYYEAIPTPPSPITLSPN